MVAMSLVRRRQLIIRGMDDPYVHRLPPLSRNTSTPAGAGVSLPHSMLECADGICGLVVVLDTGSYDLVKA